MKQLHFRQICSSLKCVVGFAIVSLSNSSFGFKVHVFVVTQERRSVPVSSVSECTFAFCLDVLSLSLSLSLSQIIVTFVFFFAKTILRDLFIQASSTLSESPIHIDAK